MEQEFENSKSNVKEVVVEKVVEKEVVVESKDAFQDYVKAPTRMSTTGPLTAKEGERLRGQVIAQTKQLDALHGRWEKLQKEHTSLKLKCAAQAKELDALKARSALNVQKLERNLTKESAMTEKQRDSLEAENKTLRNKVKDLESRLADQADREVVVEQQPSAIGTW